ncbi:MAG TPA: rhomboid family intramembrane serine protease [Firmicutes bacterium]|nr:rhomboid family intramembrane serine protease [Bacillota bacterium]
MRIPFLLKTYPATFGLCIIQLFIFFLIQSHPTVQKTIIDYGVAFPKWILDGEIWRIATAIFIQADFSHFFYNMVILLLLGTFLETYIPPMRVVLIFLASGVLSNSILLLHTQAEFVHFGSSCAISGLLGMLLTLILLRKIPLPLYTIPALVVGIACLFINACLSFHVNAFGHLCGLLGGFILGFLPKSIKKPQNLD